MSYLILMNLTSYLLFAQETILIDEVLRSKFIRLKTGG